MLYSYEAKDGSGHNVTGSLEAEDERTAMRQVHEKGYFLMKLAAQREAVAASSIPAARQTGQLVYNGSGVQLENPPTFVQKAKPTLSGWLLAHLVYPIWSGVSLRDRAVFYRQFSALLNAGVPISQSMSALVMQTQSGGLRRALARIGQIVNSGGNVSDGMREFPWIFAESHIATVVAGEMNGKLDVMLRRVADMLELEYTIRSNIIRDTWQPIIDVGGMFLIPPVVLAFFGHWDLYFQQAVLPLLETVGVVFLIYVTGRLASQLKVFYDGVFATMPPVAGLVRMIAYERFARVMASMYSAGLSVPRCVQFAADACGNEYFRMKLLKVIPFIESGHGVTDSIAHARVFPPTVISMLGTGETTGNIDQMMEKVAEFYQEESKLRLHQLCTSFRAFITIVVAARVLIILIQFYSGYFGGMMKDLP